MFIVQYSTVQYRPFQYSLTKYSVTYSTLQSGSNNEKACIKKKSLLPVQH